MESIDIKKSKMAVIVGSGPSALGFHPPDDITVIVVNGVIEWIPRADYFFTLDPSVDNIRRLNNRRPNVTYCTAGINIPNVRYFERISYRGEEPRPIGGAEWWLWRWSAVRTLATDPAKIHSGNSAWGALGLAYHLGLRNVALIGVDGTNEPRVEGGRSANLSHLPLLFESASQQINITSCGSLDISQRMSFEKWYTSSC